jgi:hypothetical protein
VAATGSEASHQDRGRHRTDCHRRGERRPPRREQRRRRSQGPWRGPPGINRAASIAGKPWRSSKAWIPQHGATHDRRLELRAVRGSRQCEGSEHRPENIAGVSAFATGMRDQSRLIVRADSSITARC